MNKFKNKEKNKSKKNSLIGLNVVFMINICPNNIRIDITNASGDVKIWYTAGKAGFKNSRKVTPHTAKVVVAHAIKEAYAAGVEKALTCVITTHGLGGAPRDVMLAAIDSLFPYPTRKIDYIKEKLTGIQSKHNGTRLKKARSV